MYKYELHVHTSECDRAAKLPAAEIVRLYHEAGYDGIVITDHYFWMFEEVWFPDDLVGADHRAYIERWLLGYRNARAEGERLGMTVLPGAEVRLDGHIKNDYLIYGVDEEFFYKTPRLHRCKSPQELVSLVPEQACVVQAHPFRDEMTVIDPSPLWGLEGFNGGNPRIRNELAKSFAAHYGKPLTSGSDYHGNKSLRLAAGGIETDRRIKSPTDLTDVLRSGAYSLIERYENCVKH